MGQKVSFFCFMLIQATTRRFFFRSRIIMLSLTPETGRTGAGLADFLFLFYEIPVKYGNILCLIITGG
jgi:hypothetical protein